MATRRTAEERKRRLEAYEDRTAWIMVVLALVYLGVFAIQVLVAELPTPVVAFLDVVALAIWITFAVDLAVRAGMSPSWHRYLLKHPIDVLAVAVPAFRFLRVLRVITAGQWLVRRGGRLASAQTATAVAVAVSFLALVGALAVLDVERGVEGAQITTFPDALWWAFVTMSTVGYGDAVPVTGAGRVVAVAMMLVGIGLVGVVSGTLASGFLARLQAQEDTEQAELLARIDELQEQVRAIHAALVPGDLETRPPSRP